MKIVAALLITILAGGAFLGIRIVNRIGQLESRIDGLSPGSNSLTVPDTTQGQEIPEVPIQPEPLELHSIKDLVEILNPHLRKNSIEELARDCAMVDNWMFPAELEPKAGDIIEKFLDLLRKRILAQVQKDDKAALAAKNGSDAEDLFNKGSALIRLYPVPSSEKGQIAFEKELQRRSEISSRIKELTFLRYNQWAVARIENGYEKFHENLRILSDGEEDLNLVRTTSWTLGEINPELLSPAAMELYMGLLRQAYEQISEAHRAALAKALNDPQVTKKSLSDF